MSCKLLKFQIPRATAAMHFEHYKVYNYYQIIEIKGEETYPLRYILLKIVIITNIEKKHIVFGV